MVKAIAGESVEALSREYKVGVAEIEKWNESGTRFEAMRPVAGAVEKVFESFGAMVAEGLRLRTDCGSQYKSKYFRKETSYAGIEMSYTFARSLESNGIIERFHRTLEEQVFAVNQFANLEEARAVYGYWFYEKQSEGVGSFFLDSLYSDIESWILSALAVIFLVWSFVVFLSGNGVISSLIFIICISYFLFAHICVITYIILVLHAFGRNSKWANYLCTLMMKH